MLLRAMLDTASSGPGFAPHSGKKDLTPRIPPTIRDIGSVID